MNEPSEQMYIPLEGIPASMSSTPPPSPTGAMKAQLHDIRETVNDIAAHLGQRDELAVLLADCRTTMTEAAGVIHSMLADVVMHLQHLDAKHAAVMVAPPRLGWRNFLRTSWARTVAGCVVGLALMGAVWQWWPMPAYQPLLTSIDRTLVTQWPWLPKGTKEALAAEYTRYGFETPATRKGTP